MTQNDDETRRRGLDQVLADAITVLTEAARLRRRPAASTPRGASVGGSRVRLRLALLAVTSQNEEHQRDSSRPEAWAVD